MGDNDGESDTESYFLTPVNEYNIVDKIQSANSLLFASMKQDNVADMEATQTQISANRSDKMLLQSKHRVTFSSDIEEYEDDVSEVDAGDVQYKDDEEIEKEIAEIIGRDEKPVSPGADSDQIDGLVKRLSIEELYGEDSASDENDYITELEVVEEINEIMGEEEKNTDDDMQKNNEHLQSVPIEPEYSMLQKVTMDKKWRSHFENKGSEINGINGSDCKACKKTSSARYPMKIEKRPATAQINRATSANNHRSTMNKEINHDELLKIHLNVRACCENKYLDNNRLPRYNGYTSQYGLSKDQLEMRELNRQKYIEKRARREREIMRAKQQIADLNEQAFQQWVIRKNRLARPKYKNMYDVVPPKLQIKYNSDAKFTKSKEHHS